MYPSNTVVSLVELAIVRERRPNDAALRFCPNLPLPCSDSGPRAGSSAWGRGDPRHAPNDYRPLLACPLIQPQAAHPERPAPQSARSGSARRYVGVGHWSADCGPGLPDAPVRAAIATTRSRAHGSPAPRGAAPCRPTFPGWLPCCRCAPAPPPECARGAGTTPLTVDPRQLFAPGARHHWLDPRGVVVGHPQLRSWKNTEPVGRVRA